MADLTVTPASVKTSSSSPTLKLQGISGAAFLAGQTLYKDVANKLQPGDVNASGKKTIAGIALCSCPGADQPCWYAKRDENFNPGATTVVGTSYVASNTPGGICPIADLTTGDDVVYVGTGKAGNLLDLDVEATGIAKP